MTDIDAMPELLEHFALGWEADIRFNKMSDGSDPGPDVKILPREQCSRETLERRIAFVREVGETVESLHQELAEAHKVIEFYADKNFWDDGGFEEVPSETSGLRSIEVVMPTVMRDAGRTARSFIRALAAGKER